MMTIDRIRVSVSEKRPYVLVAIYRSGAYANGIAHLAGKPCGSASLQTYENGPNAVETIAARAEVADGAVCLDKRAVPDDCGVGAVISGPMLDCQLPPQTVRTWDGTEAFDSVEAAAWAAAPHGMWFVSLDVYIWIWRMLGARVGRKVRGSVVWS